MSIKRRFCILEPSLGRVWEGGLFGGQSRRVVPVMDDRRKSGSRMNRNRGQGWPVRTDAHLINQYVYP